MLRYQTQIGEETARRSRATIKSDRMADPTEQTICCMSMVMMTIPNPNPKPRTEEIQESLKEGQKFRTKTYPRA
jgi:hypothetical protein